MKRDFSKKEYKYGFVSDIQSNTFKKGLSLDVIYEISKKRNEPQFILDFRLKAYKKLKEMEPPSWGNLKFSAIDFQNISYYSEPMFKDDLDQNLKNTFDRLGVSLLDEKEVAMDVVLDSVSITTTYKKKLEEYGVILCPISEAICKYPDLIKKYLGSVVSFDDNFYAALNSSVFSEGSFVYVPKNVKCPLELSTYFRINEKTAGQFERTLIIADEGASLSYLEGCSAATYDENQLHAAIVEIVALDDAKIKY
jgi:Fe-S cluster assembly protein SufB